MSVGAGAPAADRPPDPGWLGRLDLWFAPLAGRTRLVRRQHVGPLVVQRPFHPEPDGTAHVYVLHPPGGIEGGDRLELNATLAEGARALLTTPGAGKFYRTAGGAGRMQANFDIGPGAVCEYLPQETILFDGTDARIDTRIRLADAAATYLGWEFLSLGRPAAGEGFARGALRQRVEVLRAGRPIWFERLALPAGSPLLQAGFALAGRPVVATLIHAGPMAEDTAGRIRERIGAAGPCFSVSQLDHVLVCRYLGASMAEAKALFARAWEVLRHGPLGKRAIAPRVWST